MFPPGRYVLDGEIVAASFDTLGQRIHPAASRIARLAEETPATYYAFDLLALDDEVLLERSYDERRAALEAHVTAPVMLTDVVRTAADAEHWLHDAEGVIAKEADAPYRPGERTGHDQGQARAHRRRRRPRLAPGQGRAHRRRAHPRPLRRRATCARSATRAASAAKEKRELVDKLAPYETGERGSGEPSRWTQGRDLEWVALRPELVVEITFDHVSDGRIRHGAKVQRWREDKAPEACTVDQLDQ